MGCRLNSCGCCNARCTGRATAVAPATPPWARWWTCGASARARGRTWGRRGTARRRRKPSPPHCNAAAGGVCGWTRRATASTSPVVCGLDLCGVAKVSRWTRCCRPLSALGLRDLLVEVGGELRGQGKRPGGGPWQVAIAPVGPDQAPRTLHLDNQAIATSGDAWHAFEHQGRRYAHTLDPRSGRPVEHSLASVSVLHAQCMHADALARRSPCSALTKARHSRRGAASPRCSWRVPRVVCASPPHRPSAHSPGHEHAGRWRAPAGAVVVVAAYVLLCTSTWLNHRAQDPPGSGRR